MTLPHCQFGPHRATRPPSGCTVRSYRAWGPPNPRVIRPSHLPSICRMSVMGTGGAEGADAQPASRVAVSTIRTAMLIDRDGFMWHSLTWGGETALGSGASNRRVLLLCLRPVVSLP